MAQSHDATGNVLAKVHATPMFNTRMCQVEFDGGKVMELSANVITESMYAQCDADGNKYLLLDLLIDYWKDNKVISLTDQQISMQGRLVPCKFTAGWQICCKWKDSSTSCEKLSDLKESHPVQMAEFAVAQGIDHEPTFNGWVKHVLKKRDR